MGMVQRANVTIAEARRSTVPDLNDDLAALRIERAPGRRTGRWVGWLLLFIVTSAGGFAAWRWAAGAHPVEVETVVVVERAADTQAAIQGHLPS
jgi:hypothetical protein